MFRVLVVSYAERFEWIRCEMEDVGNLRAALIRIHEKHFSILADFRSQRRQEGDAHG